MGHGCVFGFLAITLCLVCSVSASSTVSISDATESVRKAKKATEDVLKSAKEQLSQAKSTSSRVDSYKQRAEYAVSKADEAAKVSSEAEAIAQKARDAKDAFMELYATGSGSVQQAVTSMQALVEEAKQLKERSDIQIRPNDNSGSDYTQTHKKATDLIAEVNELHRKLTEASPLNGAAYSVESSLEKRAEEAQLASHHVDAFVAVTNIATMMREADATIQKTEQKRDEISEIVEEMNRRNQNIPTELSSYINSLCSHAEGDLSDALDAVTEAHKAREAMQKYKQAADQSLEKVIKETDVNEAQSEARNAQWLVRQAAEQPQKITSALESATINLKSAEIRKERLLTELAKKISPPVTDHDKATTNPEEPPSGELTKPAGKFPERTVQNKPEQPLNGGTTKPADNVPERKGENNTEKPAQEGTKKPADKGKTPTDNGNSDNSITVSFPLLLGLIACAALH